MYYNAVGYALGLLDELEQARRAGREQVAAEVMEELETVRRDGLRISGEDVEQMSDEGKASWSSLRSRLAALDAASVPAQRAAEEAPEDAEESRGKGRPRTTRAPAAPESAVKPQTK